MRAFDLAMTEEKKFAELEYSAVRYGDFKHAEMCHNMRWRLMDKAVGLLRPAKLGTIGGAL